MYNVITNDISVSVLPVYMDDRSKPENHEYFWAYRVLIENLSNETVLLVSRYWRIINSDGLVREVRGFGVVGEQPMLKPGEIYEYISGCPLDKPSGIMAGHYKMKKPDGTIMEVSIPAISLDLPEINPVYN